MSIMTRNARKSSQTARTPELVVSLCISISHQPYMVTPIKAEDPDVIKAWRLEKKGADGAVYDVAVTIHGFDCSCPDFEVRRKGLDAGGCKHCKALVKVGLLEAPIAPIAPSVPATARPRVRDEFDEPAPAACCATSETAPCVSCAAPADVETSTQSKLAPASETCIACAAPADVETPRCVCADCETFPTDLLDAWDAEAPVELWPDATDLDTWELGPDANADGVPAQPTDADVAELMAYADEQSAREHLDVSETMTLAELTDRQAEFYRGWNNPAGAMFAAAMEALALRIRLTEATTPAELEARVDVLEAEARQSWEAIGYENGREFARHELLPAGPGYGHMA